MAFLDLLKQRAGAGGSPGLPDPMLIPADPPPGLVDHDGAAGRRPSPMQRIADRLEQRIADDFALFNCWLVAGRRPDAGPAIRRLAAHLAAEARPLHALGSFTMTLELSPAAANAWLLPEDVDPAMLPGGWADALYTNRLGSTEDFDLHLAGMGHMLRPGGLLVADLPAGAGIAPLDHCLSPRRGIDLDLIEARDPGLIRGRAWRRAILVRHVAG
jgi:hypothetical protein